MLLAVWGPHLSIGKAEDLVKQRPGITPWELKKCLVIPGEVGTGIGIEN